MVSIIASGRMPITDLVRSNDDRATTMRMPLAPIASMVASGW